MDTRAAASALTAWYAKNARDLPWRRDTDPYRILVSEFMLQQTRVETGLKRWPRFLARFPTLEALAHATEEQVLAEWSGLGYYARARNLHAAARVILAEHDGVVPDDVRRLQKLPGVGPYTAGALASIAYDRPEPALDGNQVRVLSRLLGDPSATRTEVEDLARRFLRHGSPRILNQALMDLAGVHCRPQAPSCAECVLRKECPSAGRVQATKAKTKVVGLEHWEALICVRGDALWMRAPAGRGLLGRIWLPPLRRGRGSHAFDVEHRFSHRTWRLKLRRLPRPPDDDGRWVRRTDLKGLPHGALTVRLLDGALAGTETSRGRAGRP